MNAQIKTLTITPTTPKTTGSKTKRRGRKPNPLNRKIFKMIEEGKTNAEIVETLNLQRKSQVVYNARYRYNRKSGLAALNTQKKAAPTVETPAPVPTMWQRFVKWFKEMTDE